MADKPSPTIESKSQLIEAISRGNKPKSDWRIGTEHEKFTFYRDDHRPVPYEGETGIGALLDKVQAETAWLPYYDRDKVIGLNNPPGRRRDFPRAGRTVRAFRRPARDHSPDL